MDLSDEDVGDLLDEWHTFQVKTDLPLFRYVPAEGNPVDKPDVWWFEGLKMKGSSGQTKYGKF